MWTGLSIAGSQTNVFKSDNLQVAERGEGLSCQQQQQQQQQVALFA